MNKLEELNELLHGHFKLNRKHPSLIVLGGSAFAELRDLQRGGLCQLEQVYDNNKIKFNGIRVLISQETDYDEITFY